MDYELPYVLGQSQRFAILCKIGYEMLDGDLSPCLLWHIDTAPSEALPLLAEQFNLGEAGWDLARNENDQRALLKDAVFLHRIQGTLYAIKRALQLLGIEAKIVEWFEENPKAQPYTFKVEFNPADQPADSPPLTPDRLRRALRAIRFWKNLRSGFSASATVKSTQTFGLGGTGIVEAIDIQENTLRRVNESTQTFGLGGTGIVEAIDIQENTLRRVNESTQIFGLGGTGMAQAISSQNSTLSN